ncbi:cuticle collagen [Aphelenchoides avenae]|nr:cuticle collagen [Aphelenchus avenae]
MGGSIRVPRQADHCPPLSVGPPGPVGDPGEDGEEGDSGWDGTPGLDAQTLLLEEAKKCVECPPGPRGPIGAPGSPGETGLKGDKGNPGIPAPDGASKALKVYPESRELLAKWESEALPGSPAPGGTGAPGIKGVKGPIGPTGPQGPRGKRNYVYGPPGLDGKPGTRGLDGLEGKPGQRGEKGPKGESGANAKFCPCPTELGRKSSSLKPFGAHADPKALAHGARTRPASNLAPLPPTSFQSDSHPNSITNDRVPLPPAKVMKTSDMGLKKEEVDAMKAEMAQERGSVTTEQSTETSPPQPAAPEEPSTRPPPPLLSSIPSSSPRSTPLKRTSLSHIAYEDAYPTYDQASRKVDYDDDHPGGGGSFPTGDAAVGQKEPEVVDGGVGAHTALHDGEAAVVGGVGHGQAVAAMHDGDMNQDPAADETVPARPGMLDSDSDPGAPEASETAAQQRRRFVYVTKRPRAGIAMNKS